MKVKKIFISTLIIIMISLLSIGFFINFNSNVIAKDNLNKLKDTAYIDSIRNKDSIETINNKIKTYIADEKKVKIEDSNKILFEAKLITPYETRISSGNSVKFAEISPIEYTNKLYDNIKLYSIDDNYNEVQKTVITKYKKETTTTECYNNPSNKTKISIEKCYNNTKTEWIKFNDMSEIPEDSTVGLFTNTIEGEHIEWVIEKDGFQLNEWASYLVTDLISYYKLDESSEDAIDAHGTYDLTESGTVPSQSSGIIEKARGAFSASNYFSSSSVPEVNLDDAWTDNLWMYRTGTLGAESRFLSRYGGTDNILYDIRLETDNTIRCVWAKSGSGLGEKVLDDSTTIPLNTWTMITTTHDTNGTVKLYINGDLKQSGTETASPITGSTSLAFGALSEGGTPLTTAYLDEYGVWERVLNSSEIEDLYNSGDGLSFGDSATAPSVTLTSPTDNANLTSSSVTFQASVTDDVFVENVTLYIDGILNETDTTHTNGSYSFSKTINEGEHNWSILAWNNQSLSNQSATWSFNYSQPPIYIDLLSPLDTSTSNIPLVNVSCRAYENDGVEQLNLTINGVVNETLTNTSVGQNLTLEKLINFSEGNYTWGCQAKNPSTTASSSNRTFEVLYSSPVVNLISPVDNANYTNTNINFIFNTTDINGIANVSLYIDGNLEETNSSGVNGSYSFSKTIVGKNHNWSILATSILGKETQSETRYYIIHLIAPTVEIFYPDELLGVFKIGGYETLNYSVTELGENLTTHLKECYHTYDTAQSTIQDEVNISSNWLDGNLNTTGFSLDASFNISSRINNIILVDTAQGAECDPNPTYTYYNINISNCSINNELKSLQVDSSSTGLFNYQWIKCDGNTLINRSYGGFGSCFSYPAELIINKTDIDCLGNSTDFLYINGKNNITIFAEDEYGLIGNYTSSWEYLINDINVSYDEPIYEGVPNTITQNISISDGELLQSAVLDYNGTLYDTSISYIGDIYVISTTAPAPDVLTTTNITFRFLVNVSDTQYSLRENSQLILPLNFSVCSGGDILLNMSLYDEEYRTRLNGDIKFNLDLISSITGSSVQSLESNITNSSNVLICLDPVNATEFFTFNSEIRYTSDGYSSELYHIQNGVLSSIPINLSLYDLKENDSTEFKIIYQDNTFNFVEDAVVQLQRKYISEDTYETVEAPLTSNEGIAIVHIDSDARKYRATIVKNGVVLDEFDNLVFKCESELTGECEQKLLGNIDTGNDRDLDSARDFYYSEPKTSGNEITTTFSIPSGLPSSVNIVLEQRDQFGNKSLCNKTIVSSAGSISCNFSETIGDSYVDLYILKNGEFIGKKSYIIHPENYLDWLDNNYILIFVLLLSLVGMALTSPEWIIINGIITMVISGGLYLASGLDFVTGLGSIAWLIFAAIILISKIAKQEDR